MPRGGPVIKNAEKALAILVGKALWTCRRAADMATFQFGARVKKADFYGKTAEVGEYALHVQCAWRVARGGVIVVGSRDLYYPAGYEDDGDEIPSSFNWERDPNRRDTLIDELFDQGRKQFTVRRIDSGAAGRLTMELSDDVSLEVFPDYSLHAEYWRFLSPGTANMKHFVVEG